MELPSPERGQPRGPPPMTGAARRSYAAPVVNPPIQTGPLVAMDGGMPTAEQLDQRYRAMMASHLEMSRGTLRTLAPLGVVVVAPLIWAGYPAWRLVAVVAAVLAMLGSEAWFSYRRSREGSLDECSGGVRAIGMRFLLVLVLDSLTGGIRSPFVPVILFPVSDLVVATGWSRPVKIMLAVLVPSLLAMALLPGAWFGPTLPPGIYLIILGATLAVAATWHTRYVLSLTRSMVATAYELRRAREEVVERSIDRAREMEQFAAKLSHELKNPLAAIKWLVQLTSRAVDDSDSREQLRVMGTEVARMEEILKEYLSFSRPIQVLRPQVVRLGALADDVVSAMEGRAANARVALRRRGDAAVEADTRKLKDALFNLLGNALEATPAGGTVEVQIEEAGQTVRIAVRDSGRGMSKEVLERLGTPFFTTREEGTGLGVAVARAAFTQHGGSLVYASEPGRGTTAVGTLPLKNGSSHVARPPG
jgi:signal transduction histidine kinase